MEREEKLNSSASAELIALREAVKCAYKWKRLVDVLWKYDCEVEFCVDAKCVTDQLASKTMKSEPSLHGMLEYVFQEIERLKACVIRVPTEKQLADRHTKLQTTKTESVIQRSEV